ncbi:retrotransposon protein, putative, ty1-copia subclass [Tanacetum coccineum]
MDGIVHTYKARLVAKSFTQTYGVDYEEMFSPVADIRAIKILIAIEAFYDYEIWQMDVKNAFLNGYLVEDIYMVQLEGFINPNHPRKTYPGKCFAIKDLGEATFILEIKIYRDRLKRLIGLSQSTYMDKILKRYRMDNFKRGYIPVQEKLVLNKTQGASTHEEVKCMQNVPYALAVGSIMYATAVKTILKYLRNTKDMFLVYGGNPEAELRVNCYCDAGFETDKDDTKSQTGYVFVLNGGTVDWKSSKQSTTAMFATGAEYIAASEAGMEAIWIRKFISGLGEIKLLKVHTDDNLADPFTNALSKGKLTQHARSMGLPAENLHLEQLDVKTAFLHDSDISSSSPTRHALPVTEEVFRDIPERITEHGLSLEITQSLGGSSDTSEGCYIPNMNHYGNHNPELSNPTLVLDDSCIMKCNFNMSLMGKVKDVTGIPNLYNKEVFENVNLTYLEGLWILIELDSLVAKEKFSNHVGVGLWFSSLIAAYNSFVSDERIVWVSIEGLPLKAWTHNTFAKVSLKWGELVEWEDSDNNSLSCKRLCVRTKLDDIYL